MDPLSRVPVGTVWLRLSIRRRRGVGGFRSIPMGLVRTLSRRDALSPRGKSDLQLFDNFSFRTAQKSGRVSGDGVPWPNFLEGTRTLPGAGRTLQARHSKARLLWQHASSA